MNAPEEAREFASPACSAHEMDDGYMGFASRAEILAALETFLQAEHALAQATLWTREEVPPAFKPVLAAMHEDAFRGRDRIAQSIRRLGGVPSRKAAALCGEAMAMADIGARIAFLDWTRGEMTRRMRALLPRVRDDAVHAELSALCKLGSLTMPDDEATRRERIVAQIQADTGIDEAMIERLVRGFYARVREDAVLGPIFDAKIDDWEAHIRKLCAFWSSLALMSGRYSGKPFDMHVALPVDARHFDRWLALFERTAREMTPPAAADHFMKLARRVAESLELGVAGAQGVMLRKGERFRAG